MNGQTLFALLLLLYASNGFTQSYHVVFRVDMNGVDSISASGVHVATNAYGWNPSLNELLDEDNDGIYELRISIPTGVLEYKYINGNSWAPNAVEFPVGNNRVVEISDNIILPTYKFDSYDTTPMPRPTGLKLGANFIADQVVFLLEAPQKDFLCITGDFNGWDIMPMKQDEDYWWIALDTIGLKTESDTLRYKYREPRGDTATSDLYFSDPYGFETAIDNGGNHNSVIRFNDTSYVWKNTVDRVLPKDLIIYEMHIQDYTREGTFQAAKAKLPLLQELGVNAIELMPPTMAGTTPTWGYNPRHFFSVHNTYGTKNDLKEFIDEAHRLGIAVIMDIVLNHCAGCPLYLMYDSLAINNPFLNFEPFGVYGDGAPCFGVEWGTDFNHESQYTQRFVDRFLEYWTTEFHFDGYRLDFTKGLSQNQADSDCGNEKDDGRIAIIRRIVDKIREFDSNAYVILEHLVPDFQERQILAELNVLQWVGKEINERYIESIAKGEWNFIDVAAHDHSFWGVNLPIWISYYESHDEERFGATLLDDNDDEIHSEDEELTDEDYNRAKAALAFNMLMPGPRMIWQFQEYVYDFSIMDEIHVDSTGVIEARLDAPSADEERYKTSPKPSAFFVRDPSSDTTYACSPKRLAVYNWLKEIIQLRKKEGIFEDWSFQHLQETPEHKQLKLAHKGEFVLVYANCAKTDSAYFDVSKDILAAAGQWRRLKNDGSGYEAYAFPDKSISLAPGEVLVLKNKINETLPIVIHFKKPPHWNAAYIHIWNNTCDSTSAWPGILMEKDTTAGCEGWYSYTLPCGVCTDLVFHDGSGLQTADMTRCGEGWYNGNWYSTENCNSTVHYYPAYPTKPKIHYWDSTFSTTWPGLDMDLMTTGWYVFTLPYENCANFVLSNEGNYQSVDLLTCGDTFYIQSAWKEAPLGTLGDSSGRSTSETTITNHPNPFSKETTLAVTLKENAVIQIVVMDIQGKIVKQITRETYEAGNHLFNLEMNDFPAGIYFCQLNTEDEVITLKINKMP